MENENRTSVNLNIKQPDQTPSTFDDIEVGEYFLDSKYDEATLFMKLGNCAVVIASRSVDPTKGKGKIWMDRKFSTIIPVKKITFYPFINFAGLGYDTDKNEEFPFDMTTRENLSQGDAFIYRNTLFLYSLDNGLYKAIKLYGNPGFGHDGDIAFMIHPDTTVMKLYELTIEIKI